MMNIEQLIWNNLVTQPCAPVVCNLLDDADFYPIGAMSSTDRLKAFTKRGNMRPIQGPGGQLHPRTMGGQS
eukprot:1002337-Amphidinium_carterae.1